MDTNKMRDVSREQFEHHYLVELSYEECDFHMDGDRYVWQATEDRWYAWQASRAAVVVELPDPNEVHDTGDYCAEAIDAIEAQGLKVLP
ncbi:hypothetical protein [Pseudomonas alabamensis]|uniref:hypothetical protein n=1 Tax=Pseudomonas alabamensis TaxID=3064349 RepID=UPI000745D772|nr:hypothetical protein APT63_11845 [Pseudomonas monteilii]